ncbi:MAG: hypothetical protein TH68_10025 [Candidatus Synechococcus spongiarum 142]|uniref:Uncharacterized protein n=1 Tax=Candidatus Synechococcus spongiarum 142 TaxID=1608213 RepID=A0A6N3X6D1_9SYNE|nr:MAG: hypothetical protein TH68_10025 [Candidatus Synechococcus spongiarum 142]
MNKKAKTENLPLDLDAKGPVSSQEGDWRAVRQEDRQDRDQAHGHNRFWAEFWTGTCLLVSLAGGGLLVAVLNEDAILRTGGMSVFSGVAGAVIQREASQHKKGRP